MSQWLKKTDYFEQQQHEDHWEAIVTIKINGKKGVLMSKQIILTVELSSKMNKIIGALREKIQPECIVFTDISGKLLSSYLRNREISIENLAALFASSMGATNEIANEICEKDGFDFNLHEGREHCIFISRIASSFILAVVFHSLEAVGMVRLFTKRACIELLALTEEFEGQMTNPNQKRVDDSFSDELSKKIELLFQ